VGGGFGPILKQESPTRVQPEGDATGGADGGRTGQGELSAAGAKGAPGRGKQGPRRRLRPGGWEIPVGVFGGDMVAREP